MYAWWTITPDRTVTLNVFLQTKTSLEAGSHYRGTHATKLMPDFKLSPGNVMHYPINCHAIHKMCQARNKKDVSC